LVIGGARLPNNLKLFARAGVLSELRTRCA
jgi:hypothetical protein